MASRHTITIPKDAEANNRFAYGEVVKDDLIQWFLTEEEFRALWDSGIFSLINQASNVGLEEYEEEAIEGPQKIHKAIATLEAKDLVGHPKLQKLTNKLISLLQEALKREVAIYFWF